MQIVKQDGNSPFDAARQMGVFGEFWSARDLMPLLGYARWQEFREAIDRAKISCKLAGLEIEANFHASTRENSGQSRGRKLDDVQLSRFATYLIAMNGNPARVEIAQAQMYFAVMTRKAELMSHPKPPVVAPLAIARAYSRPASTIPVWIQHYGLEPAGYALDPITGKPIKVYWFDEVKEAFSLGHGNGSGLIELRPYSGEWHEGLVPSAVLPPSRKELAWRLRTEVQAKREAEETAWRKKHDDWDREHGLN